MWFLGKNAQKSQIMLIYWAFLRLQFSAGQSFLSLLGRPVPASLSCGFAPAGLDHESIIGVYVTFIFAGGGSNAQADQAYCGQNQQRCSRSRPRHLSPLFIHILRNGVLAGFRNDRLYAKSFPSRVYQRFLSVTLTPPPCR